MQLVSKYKSFVIANQSWADALAQALGFKNADALKQAEDKGKEFYLSEAVVEKLAQAHAEAYGEKNHCTIFFQQSVGGSWYFYTDEDCTRENRHDSATKQWQRTVGKYHKVSKKKASRVSTKVDAVQQLVEKFEALSKTEQAKFLRIIK